MLTVNANVTILKGVSGSADKICSGFRITIRLGQSGYLAQLYPEEGEWIYLDRGNNIKMNIVYGEIALEEILVNKYFEVLIGDVVGKGEILSIEKIIIEPKALELVEEIKDRRRIINIAEQYENVTIPQEIYSVL